MKGRRQRAGDVIGSVVMCGVRGGVRRGRAPHGGCGIDPMVKIGGLTCRWGNGRLFISSSGLTD